MYLNIMTIIKLNKIPHILYGNMCRYLLVCEVFTFYRMIIIFSKILMTIGSEVLIT